MKEDNKMATEAHERLGGFGLQLGDVSPTPTC
jgi:hypothetical protein